MYWRVTWIIWRYTKKANWDRTKWHSVGLICNKSGLKVLYRRYKGSFLTWLRSALDISSSSRQGNRWTKDSIWYFARIKFALIGLKVLQNLWPYCHNDSFGFTNEMHNFVLQKDKTKTNLHYRIFWVRFSDSTFNLIWIKERMFPDRIGSICH